MHPKKEARTSTQSKTIQTQKSIGKPRKAPLLEQAHLISKQLEELKVVAKLLQQESQEKEKESSQTVEASA